MPAVGDIRNCIVALADAEPHGRGLQYRFPESERTGSSDDATTLGGHAVGNLLIAALTAVKGGDFEEGVRQMNRVLAVRGQVLPVSPTPLVLHCETRDGWEVHGQSAVATTTDIERVWVTPGDVAVSEDALRAIAEADVVVLGPGSLYTSILPGVLLEPIRDAILASPALRVYVCNVATQEGETAGYDLADHVDALERHAAAGIVDVVLANSHVATTAPTGRGEAVRPRWPPAGPSVPRLVLDDVVDPAEPTHHDPATLAAAIIRIVEREGGARRRAGVARTREPRRTRPRVGAPGRARRIAAADTPIRCGLRPTRAGGRPRSPRGRTATPSPAASRSDSASGLGPTRCRRRPSTGRPRGIIAGSPSCGVSFSATAR